MRVEQAQVIVDFLATKFTSFDLYDWMSDILERVYRFFLQQATTMAQVAAGQLALNGRKH